MEWFTTQPRVHKYLMDIAESGLLFQIKLNMVWIVEIPSKQIYNQLNGPSMVPFRATPGFTFRRPSSFRTYEQGYSAAL